MASRPAPQHPRVEPPGGENQQTKKNVAEVKNRRVLGDIGNRIPQRPLTRRFCAQLMADAKAAALGEPKEQKQSKIDVKNVKPSVDAIGLQKAPVVNVKSSPQVVIEISPESQKLAKEKKGWTSILTARSKKISEEFVDIDAADANNHLAATEYVDDLYKFYKEAENECLPRTYMDLQPEISSKMRTILVDWLIDVHTRFDLSQETLYLTISIIDRFLSVKTVPRSELQLLGIGAIFTASKYEEIWAPQANDLVLVSDRAYSHRQILQMEKVILKHLEWTLTVPTPYVFLARFIKASIPDKLTENMVYYLAELGLMNYEMMVGFRPSMMAASAVYAARCTLSKEPWWTETLKVHTGYSETELKRCAGMLVDLHAKAREETRLRAVVKKYQSGGREAILKYLPASLVGECRGH